MCSFTALAYSAVLDTTYVFPIVLHHSKEGFKLNQTDASSMVWDKGRDSINNCLNGPCTNSFPLAI